MIEIPRAALTADEIAKEADFFCFGTNDLTQMTYGFSVTMLVNSLNAYYDAKIFENDPFAKLDQVGVGKLMEMAIELGRPVNPNLHVGICGEHGGDPSSVEFCNKIGLDYVSCSPFRVPIARLAAAQAAKKSNLITGILYVLFGVACLIVALLIETKLEGILWGLCGAGIFPNYDDMQIFLLEFPLKIKSDTRAFGERTN